MPDAPGDAVPESAQGFVAGMMASRARKQGKGGPT